MLLIETIIGFFLNYLSFFSNKTTDFDLKIQVGFKAVIQVWTGSRQIHQILSQEKDPSLWLK